MKFKGVRWYMCGLLMLATVVNYLDRSCLGAVGPVLKKDLQIDEQQFAYIIMCFQFSYAAMMPIAGSIIDWLGTRKGYMIAVLWWSIANMLHGFAGSARSLAIFRGLLGIGESGNFPAAIKTISEWFPAKERTIATGIFNTGSSVGAMIAPPLVIWIVLTWHWQAAFVVTGAVGFLWLLLWIAFYRAPKDSKYITEEERAYILAGQKEEDMPAETQSSDKWYKMLAVREFWAIAIARFLAEPAWQFFTYWIPLYLFTVRGLDLKQIAMFAWMPPLAGDLGCLFGGFLSPFFMKHGVPLLRARKYAALVGSIIMMFAVFIGMSSSVYWAIFFFCVGSFAHQSLSSTYLTLPADLFPQTAVASANGWSGGIGQFGGMLSTFVVGYVVMHIGYNPLFVAIGCLDLIGVAALWVLLRERKVCQA
ncbi:MAG: MFS transporter [Negativicutes bacterium]|jgi:ACS family hexuronate transporter-like MFS transporter